MRRLFPGEPGPWFTAPCTSNERFAFNSVAGRFVVLCFFGSAADPLSRQVLVEFFTHGATFNDESATFFGVSVDPTDRTRVREQIPGFRFFWDFDSQISVLYQAKGEAESSNEYRRFSVVLDERLRIVAVVPFMDDARRHVESVLEALNGLPEIPAGRAMPVTAPILIVPRIFEPELCRDLIRYYDERGGEDSGFMRDVEGTTVLIVDHGFKRRRDQEIQDERLRNAAMHRVHDRLVPEIKKAFQFSVTRIERHIVACYDARSGGYFQPHRDNTTLGTAHRRFAVSLNLNTGAYSGGKLRFPEFGRHEYEAPAGGAVVFSCSLLHEATPVEAGSRYVYLPFLYDDEAAKIRAANQRFLEVRT